MFFSSNFKLKCTVNALFLKNIVKIFELWGPSHTLLRSPSDEAHLRFLSLSFYCNTNTFDNYIDKLQKYGTGRGEVLVPSWNFITPFRASRTISAPPPPHLAFDLFTNI